MPEPLSPRNATSSPSRIKNDSTRKIARAAPSGAAYDLLKLEMASSGIARILSCVSGEVKHDRLRRCEKVVNKNEAVSSCPEGAQCENEILYFGEMSTNQTVTNRGISAAEPPVGERQRNVFIVDDEPMVGEVVSAVLDLEGYNTRLFTSPLDALDAFEAAVEKPDLMITDHVMQPISGLDLIARCRALLPNLRTILYSGQVDDDSIKMHETQADAFLSKPFLPKELIHTVQGLLAK